MRSMSHAAISCELNIPRRTVSNFLTRFKSRGTLTNLPHPGWPRITTVSQDKRIIAAAETHTRVPFAELPNIINIVASESTIRRCLHEDNIWKWRAVKRPLLMEHHAATHLKWAREHQHKTREDWVKIAWSDVVAIQKDSARQQVWVFRHQTKEEKYASKNDRGKTRDGDISQMIWAYFAGNKLGPIAFIDGTVNSDVCIDILHNNLLPYLDALANDGISGITFQQDNARPHTSKKTSAFLNAAMIEHGFQVMEWPPNSPRSEE